MICIQHRKSFLEVGPRNGETAWLGEPKETVFGLALGWSSVSNVVSKTYKKEGFTAEVFNLHLAVALVCTSHWLRDAP